MPEQNQTTWRARVNKMRADGLFSYATADPRLPAPQPPAPVQIAPVARVKFICTRMQRFMPWAALHHPNLQKYCNRYGYTYVTDLDYVEPAQRLGHTRAGDAEMDYVIERIYGNRQLMVDQLHDCDLLVWLGADTVVTNMTVRIEDVMPQGAHVAMPMEECYECDAVIVRNSAEGRSFLEDWGQWMLDENHPVWQQYGNFVPPQCKDIIGRDTPPGTFAPAMRKHLFHDDAVLTAVCARYPEHAARIHTFDRHGFVVKHVHWHPGDFIMHVPGSPDVDRVQHMYMGLAQIVE